MKYYDYGLWFIFQEKSETNTYFVCSIVKNYLKSKALAGFFDTSYCLFCFEAFIIISCQKKYLTYDKRLLVCVNEFSHLLVTLSTEQETEA